MCRPADAIARLRRTWRGLFGVTKPLMLCCCQDAGINPSVGEPVAFRLAVNHAAVKAAAGASGLAAAHAGRRATQVLNV